MTHLVVCSDHFGLPALHTCILTAAENTPNLEIHLVETGLSSQDIELLQKTLGTVPLSTYRVDASHFEHLRPMSGSFAPYFRLLAPAIVPVERFIYLDTDILVGTSLDEIANFDLGSHPAAMVPEVEAEHACDTGFLAATEASSHPHYFNSGVILIDTARWKEERITERCLEYLEKHTADFWDQTALNIVIGSTCPSLPERFNIISNERRHWPLNLEGNILHLADRPKPWDTFGKHLHPQAHLWWPAFQRTALAGKLPSPSRATGGFVGYRKALKDSLLTRALHSGLTSRVKGMP